MQWFGVDLDLGWWNLFCACDRRWSFVELSIVLFSAGVQFVGCGVDREWFSKGYGGDLDHGLPPHRFGWSSPCAGARLSFALWRGWLLLSLVAGFHVCCQGFD